MIKKMNAKGQYLLDCQFCKRNGATWLTCEKTNQKCPFQRWCTNKHIFELIGNSTTCPMYKKR